MQGEDINKYARKTIHHTTAKLNNIFKEQYNTEINNAFSRLHNITGEENKEYNPYEYKRIGFKDLTVATRFQQEMHDRGVETVRTGQKLYGQYLIELPRNNYAVDTSEDENLQVTEKNKQKKTWISAEDLINNFKSQTFEKIDDANEVKGNAYVPTIITNNQAVEIVTDYMDVFGQAIRKSDQLEYSLSPYKAFANKEIFTEKNNGTLHYDTGRTKGAIVLNNNTVIEDGKIVTDQKERAYVLQQHEKRITKADSILNSNPIFSSTKYDNAQLIKDNIYKQEYQANNVKSNASITGGTLNQYRDIFGTEAIALNSTSGSALKLKDEERQLLTKIIKNNSINSDASKELSDILSKKEITTYKDRLAIQDTLNRVDNNIKNGYLKLDNKELECFNTLKNKDRGIALNDKEMNAFTDARHTLKSIKQDLGIDLVEKPIDRKDLVEITNKFLDKSTKAGYQFVVRTPLGVKLDIEALKKLTPAQLKKIGISKRTLDTVLDLNNGSWGKKNFNGNFVSLLVSGLCRLGDEESSRAIKDLYTVAKMPRHAKEIFTSVKQVSDTLKARHNIKKAKKEATKPIIRTKKPSPNKKQPIKKKPKAPKNRKLNAKNTAKYKKKMMMKERKLAYSEKSVFTQFKNFGSNIKRKIANNKLVKIFSKLKAKIMMWIAKGVIVLLGIGLVLMGFICIITIVLTTIQSFLNYTNKAINEGLAPETYKDTVCYKMYECLLDDEKQWESATSNRDLFKDKENLRFGLDYTDYNLYINMFNKELIQDGNDLYINPYKTLMSKDPSIDIDSSYMTKVKSFDGKFNVQYGTNYGQYSKVRASQFGSTDTYAPAENGHTSNIKDIIAMCDVMYDFDTDNCFDGDDASGLQSILGQSPAQNDWKTTLDKTGASIKWAFKNIKAYFSFDNEGYVPLGDLTAEWDKSNTRSYKTMLNYAKLLFEISHQNSYELSVEYYPIQDNITLNAQGKEVKLNKNDISQANASQFGVCIEPEVNSFPIYWNNGVTPCVITKEGRKIDVDGSNPDINFKLKLSDLVEGENLSLWNDMGSNEETYKKISTHPDWSIDKSAEKSEDYGLINYTGKATANDKATAENNARKLVEDGFNKYQNEYLEKNKDQLKNKYVLTTDRNEFQCINYEKQPIGTINVTTEEKTDGGTSTFTATANFTGGTVKKHTVIYKRDQNKKYKFKYDGGHICVNSTGITYSITNEQLTLANAYDEQEMELHDKDFDVKTEYGGKIRGKYEGFKEDGGAYEINYNSVQEASETGLSKNPQQYLQGSAITQKRGLNLYIDSNGRLGKGFYYIGAELNPNNNIKEKDLYAGLFKDIFDADCSILKGSNVFPWKDGDYRSYRGWDEDNMTIACLKTSMDWNDVYGFDIPYELGVSNSKEIESEKGYTQEEKQKAMNSNDTIFSPCCISTKDRNGIIDALKDTYGASFDEDRQEAVRHVLRFVGRGHRTNNYLQNGLLNQYLKTRTLDVVAPQIASQNPDAYPVQHVSSTGTQEFGFVDYIYKYFNKPVLADRTVQVYNDLSTLLPADVIEHKGENYTQAELDESPENLKKDMQKTTTAITEYSKNAYAIYLGTLSEDYTMENGRVLKAGEPLTVDIGLKGQYSIGSIRLESETATSWLDYVDNPLANYYWVTNPNSNNCEVYKWN